MNEDAAVQKHGDTSRELGKGHSCTLTAQNHTQTSQLEVWDDNGEFGVGASQHKVILGFDRPCPGNSCSLLGFLDWGSLK